VTGNRFRCDRGGRIDRKRPLDFTFNGRPCTGFEGDTLASALLANGIVLTSRSFRYHRPRGIFSAGVEECHALVSVGEGAAREPNVRATRQWLTDGLVANSQNGWPSLKWDLPALSGWLSRFLPAGFYYKTFLWPHWKWYEGLVRRMAGIATPPDGPDPDRYDKRNFHCDLLIVGAGPAGLAAALAAAPTGLRILLADDQPEFGGSLLWDPAEIEGIPAAAWADQATSKLTEFDNVTLLRNTMVVAAWDHGYFTAVEGRADGQRLWKIRSSRTLLACGAIERPLVFPDNDRPGIMLADSARQYLNRFAVRPGTRAVVYTNNDTAYRAAIDLHTRGVLVRAIVDVRDEPPPGLQQEAQALGIELFTAHEIAGTRGYLRLGEVRLRPRKPGVQGGTTIRIEADLLCMSGGWNPTLHLFSQAGGKLAYDERLACFLPAESQPPPLASIRAAGSANGCFGLSGCLAEGHRAAVDTAALLGREISSQAPTSSPEGEPRPGSIEPYWQTTPPCKGRQWVDHLHDVTTDSIAVAVCEGYSSVEHLKRYTTIGMAADQGKTANVPALAILGEATGRAIAAVGTTTFRPPFQPVTLGALAGRETGPRAWPVRRLPLHDWHVEAGGVMEDHSGWQRAAYYPRGAETEEQAIHREVLAARRGVALFDSSSLGKIEVCGPDAARFLNRMYINNVETLKTGKVRYGMMLNENGVIVDDGVFTRLADDFFLVSASSAGTAGVLLAFEEWLQTEWPELDVLVHNATNQWATMAVSGPDSRTVLGAVFPELDLSPDSFPHMSSMEFESEGIPLRLMRVSFTGELSFELSVPAGLASSAWEKLLQVGEPFGIAPLGMEALDVLRTEKGFLEVGVDTDVTTTPLDVGWAAAISKKAADFIGKRSLSRPHDTRAGRLQLVGLKPLDQQEYIPVGAHIVSAGDRSSEGHVTSSCISPTLGYSIAMCMLKSGHDRLGGRVVIDVDSRQVPAEVTPLAFHDPGGERLKM
jgi:sarcosine oxidase subunit alpha